MSIRQWLICLGILCVASVWQGYAAYLGLSSRDTALLGGWDNNFYFMWGRSIAIDGDIDFRNDIEYIAKNRKLGLTQQLFAAYLAENSQTETGLIKNKYAMGLGVLALPSLWSLKWVTTITGNADPFFPGYMVAFMFSSILAACVGLVLSMRLLTAKYGRSNTTLSVCAAVVGLSLGYYILFEPGMSHAAGFGCVTVFIWACLRWLSELQKHIHTNHSKRLLCYAFLMGLLLGLSALVRFTSFVYAMLPLSMALVVWLQAGRHNTKSWVLSSIRSLGIASAGAVLGFAPQLLAWRAMFGSLITYPYGDATLTWIPWHAFDVLIGPVNSLFVWTPIALFAVLGLVLGARRGNVLCIGGIVLVVATTWIYGSWETPGLGHAFGMRGFVEISFFFMLGLAELWVYVAAMATGLGRRLIASLLVVMVCWNIYFMVCYRAEIQPHGQAFAGVELFLHGDRWLQQLFRDTGLGLLIK